MANLSNMLVTSKNTRLNDMIVRGAIDVGYTGMAGGSGLAITVRAVDREESKARDYRLELSHLDLGKVIERVCNPLKHTNLSNWGTTDKPTSEHHLYEELLLDHGLKYDWYRYPTEPFANGTPRWYWCQGVNRYHAEHQLSRLLRDFNPALLEEYQEEDNSNGS